MQFIFDGPEDADVMILLAHGAGAPMDSTSMNAIVDALAQESFRVARFEFSYMAARREGGGKPPPKAEKLIDEYRNAVAGIAAATPLIIGGKSMGGRVASMLADQMHAEGAIAGLLCLGYPFHPPAKPDQLRTAHLENLSVPTLVIQGTRDPFGTNEEVDQYQLSEAIKIFWLEDGDHDLKPRKKFSGFSVADHLKTMAMTTRDWANRITAG